MSAPAWQFRLLTALENLDRAVERALVASADAAETGVLVGETLCAVRELHPVLDAAIAENRARIAPPVAPDETPDSSD